VRGGAGVGRGGVGGGGGGAWGRGGEVWGLQTFGSLLSCTPLWSHFEHTS